MYAAFTHADEPTILIISPDCPDGEAIAAYCTVCDRHNSSIENIPTHKNCRHGGVMTAQMTELVSKINQLKKKKAKKQKKTSAHISQQWRR